MRIVKCVLISVGLAGAVRAQTGCTGPDGNLFNLEARPNAVVQAAQSVAFLPGAGIDGNDLVVATATDMRGIASTNDAFYVARGNANCAADFEGGVPFIQNIFGSFAGFGTPTVVADAARGAFFIADLRFGGTDNNGVGIIRTTAARLLSSSACPSGTQTAGSASCWNVGAVTNITSLNAFLDSPHIAVDGRTTGAGAGDVYVVVGQRSASGVSKSITITACTNAQLSCGASVAVSGADVNADFPWVQVRPDGGITVSYRNTTFPGVNPQEIKFVNCTPNGAPNPPTCTAAVMVSTENNPVFASLPGDVPMTIDLYPRHAHRLESDGKMVTTFLVYGRCRVPVMENVYVDNFCPKSDVALTTSTDSGASWRPLENVTAASGQQFFGSLAVDASTGVVNIAYYSTENDPFAQRPQIFLAQVPQGSTVPDTPELLTANFGDVQATSPLEILLEPVGFGDRLGLAAAGTGAAGHSRIYCGFTWNSVAGTYNGVASPDMNNHLVQFTY